MRILSCFFVFFGLALFLSVQFPSYSFAGQCLEDVRKVQLDGKKVVRFRNYLCRTDNGGAQVSVEFHRMSDIMASALLTKKLPASVREIFRGGTIIKNDVHKEFSFLLERFGNSVEGHQVNYQISAAGTKEQADGYNTEGNGAAAGIKSLQFGGTIDMPLVDDLNIVNNQTSWPKGYKLFYGALYADSKNKKAEIVRNTRLWRYLKSGDLENYEQNIKRYTNIVKGDPKHPKRDFGDWFFQVPRYIKMLKHVTRTRLPKDFLMITGGVPASCGEDDPHGEFTLSTRPVLLDVAVIKNRSANTLELDGLLGATNDKRALRSKAHSKRLYNKQPVKFGGSYRLKSGQSIIVPMKMIFATLADSGICVSKECKSAERASYRYIRSLKKGTLLKAGRIVKKRKSFKKPKLPRAASGPDYVYGPEIAIAGMSIAGERVILKDHSANFVQLTTGSGVGSCPYLYAQEPNSKRWLGYGKVIHTADNKAKKTTQIVKLKGFASRFRLIEHELELSYIDQVQLVLDLHDGRKINLQSDNKSLGHRDGVVQKIYAGQTVEFSFELPDHIAKKDVKNSSLAITGYYRRYGSMIMSAR